MTFRIGTPHTKGAGYFLNDRGLSTRQEADVQTCPHCQGVIKMQEWRASSIQNFCLKCMKPACNSQACEVCVPFVHKLELAVQSQRRVSRMNQFLKRAGFVAPVPSRTSKFTGL